MAGQEEWLALCLFQDRLDLPPGAFEHETKTMMDATLVLSTLDKLDDDIRLPVG